MWAGYLGPEEQTSRLKRLLGDGTQIVTGRGFGLGVKETGGETASLITAENGRIRAALGDAVEYGCAATIDPDGSTVVLECDLFGLYTIYTTRQGDCWWFASNLRALLQCLDTPPELDPVGLHGYLCFSYVPTPRTLFYGVSAWPAGSRICLTPSGASVESMVPWRERQTRTPSGQEPIGGSEDEAAMQLLGLLRAAVVRRLGTDHEVGVFLSGGLDSSLIAALLVEAGARLRLFTLDFGPPWNGELDYAQQVAVHLKQPLTVVAATPKAVRSALHETAAALQQAFGDGVVVPLMLLGKAASGQVQTVFNGEGGDQLFGGWANKPMIAAEMYSAVGYNREAAYLETLHRFYGLTGQLYTGRMCALTAGVDVGAWVRDLLKPEPGSTLLHQLRAANLALKGAQNIAPRTVQLAAAQGLKVRSPFFDCALTEASFKLPPEWLLRAACEKYLLKRVAQAYLPAEIVWREKRGMGVPVTEWCLGPLRRDVARALHPRRLKREDRFDPRFVAALRRGEDQPGEIRRRRIGEKLWTLLMFQIWIETT